jgi:hypothetical protein
MWSNGCDVDDPSSASHYSRTSHILLTCGMLLLPIG